MVTMVQKRQAMAKPITGELLFVRHPVGTATLEPETAVIRHGEKIGPLFPFTLNSKLEIITEYHPWFGEETGKASPWGRAVLPPEALNAIMLGYAGTDKGYKWPDRPEDKWLRDAAAGRTPVGLFGGCEVIIYDGPVFADEVYELERELVGKGETPGAEYKWTRTLLKEPGTGRLIAEMTLQDMMLKRSFPGYQKLRMQSDALARGTVARL